MSASMFAPTSAPTFTPQSTPTFAPMSFPVSAPNHQDTSSFPAYFTDLNDQQQLAVQHGAGPAMVLAGAGSGKTKVLTTRVAHLLHHCQIPPDHIVLLTFTNKAAQEMNTRVQQLTGLRLSYAGTFHSLCARLLRQYGEEIHLPATFVIYDGDDQISLLKLIAKELNLDAKRYPPRVLLASISEAKQQLLNPEEYAQFARGSFQDTMARVYRRYEQRLTQAGAVDFDNLLVKAVQLLRQSPARRQELQRQWEHVLIDEYQDTNHAQYVLTKLLAFPQNNLFVVGDASQAIYGWRGADYRNLLKLKQDFAQVAEYRLERNYRSTPSILAAASGVIKNNTLHPVLELWTDNADQEPIQVFAATDGADEARQVVQAIRRLGESAWNETAVLYRTNAQSREFEEALLRAGVSYQLVGGVAFYARKEVKDILAYVRLVAQPTDTVSDERAQKNGKRRYQAFVSWREQLGVERTAHGVTPSSLEIIEGLLAATKYLDQFDEHNPQDLSRLENVQELKSVAAQFPDLSAFLEQVALVGGEMSAKARVRQAHDGPAITLMSLHAAKGLEFDYVFLVGLEEGLFPHSRALMDREQMEEERRLCYVGMTRARRQLVLSYAQRRLLYGSYTPQLPARFLKEVPASVLAETSTLTPPRTDINDPAMDAMLNGDLDVMEWLNG